MVEVKSGAWGGAGSRGSSRYQQQGRPLSLLRVPDDADMLLQQLPEAWRQVAMLQLRPLEHVQALLQHQQQQQQSTASCSAGIGGSSSSNWRQQQQQGSHSSTWLGVVPAAYCQPCVGPSPFPLLDKFIGSVCSQGGVAGEVRSWLMQPGPGSFIVMFNIRGNRWCGNIGRQHRSNGIFYCGKRGRGLLLQHSAGVCVDAWVKCCGLLRAAGVCSLGACARSSSASGGSHTFDCCGLRRSLRLCLTRDSPQVCLGCLPCSTQVPLALLGLPEQSTTPRAE